MNTNTHVLINKTVEELAPLFDSGEVQAIYAHTGKQGVMGLYHRAPGQYSYGFEYCRVDMGWDSGKDVVHTLLSFLQSIDFAAYSGPCPDYAQEMQDLLKKPVWSTMEEYEYAYRFE